MQYCMNCGAQVLPSARFCPGCGAAADNEATRVAAEGPRFRPVQPQAVMPMPRMPEAPPRESMRKSGETERVVFTVRPTLLFIKIGYGLAALVGLLLVAFFSSRFPPSTSYVPYIAIVFALGLLLIPAYYHIRRNLIKYTLTDSKVEIEEGFFSQTTRNLPLRNIQDVTVKTTLLQRMLGFGDIVIDNASEEGGVTVLDNIPEPRRHMEMLLRELRRWR